MKKTVIKRTTVMKGKQLANGKRRKLKQKKKKKFLHLVIV